MRQFYKHIVANLYTYCGNRQAEKMTDEELKTLYDALERVSKLYAYIPEEKQKEIIEAQLIKDKEYQNINARLISRWLEENGKQYFVQECHRQDKGRLTEADYTPLQGEARDKAIQTALEAIAKVGHPEAIVTPVGGGSRMREQFRGLATAPPKPEEMPAPKAPSALDEFCAGTGDYANTNETKTEQP